MSKPLPTIPLEVLQYLEGIYPDRCPDTSMNEKEVWFAAGSAAVTRHLRFILEQQQENLLEKI